MEKQLTNKHPSILSIHFLNHKSSFGSWECCSPTQLTLCERWGVPFRLKFTSTDNFEPSVGPRNMLLECGRKHVSLEPGIEPSFSPLAHRAAQVTTPIVRQINFFLS